MPAGSDTEQRGRDRIRRVAASALASAAARVVTALAAFCVVPVALPALGAERYGVWTAIVSGAAMVSFMDLGLGLGLLNRMSDAHGREDRDEQSRLASNAFFMLLAVALGMGLLMFLALPWIPLERFFKGASPEVVRELPDVVRAALACFLAMLPLGVANQIQLAHQESYRSSAFSAFGSVMSLIGVLVALALEGGLAAAVFGAALGPVIGAAANSGDLYFRRKPWLRPRLAQWDHRVVRSLFGTGLLFLVIQLSALVAYDVDNLVLAWKLGPESVTQYYVTAKLFMQIPIILGFALNPLWPAYTEALAKGDVDWAMQTLWKSIRLGLWINGPLALAAVLAAPWLISLWSKGMVHPDPLVLKALGLWILMNAFNGPLAVFLNGAGALRFQALVMPIMAAANLGLSILAVERYGVAGVVIGSMVAQVLFVYLPLWFYFPTLKAGLYRRQGSPPA